MHKNSTSSKVKKTRNIITGPWLTKKEIKRVREYDAMQNENRQREQNALFHAKSPTAAAAINMDSSIASNQ